jgi:outer membrane lipoprotein LolB
VTVLRVFFACFLLLGGCATDQKQLDRGENQPQQQQVWAMEGRLGVHAEKNAWQANLNWEHDHEQDRLRISGPLSQGLISIIVQKDLIYVNEGDGKTELSRNPAELLRQRLGFYVPLESLRFWIMGVANPRLAHQDLGGDAGRVGGFEQEGWMVEVIQLDRESGWNLPAKLKIRRGEIQLKIVVDRWSVGEKAHEK